MKLSIQGRDIEVTESIHDYVQQKIGKVMGAFEDLMPKVDVKLSVPRSSRKQLAQIAEVTVYASGNVIRAEECHENLYASIDLVADKLNRQLRRYKDKKQRRTQSKQEQADARNDSVVLNDLALDRTPELPQKVARNKFFAMPAMSAQEALENLQLVDHDFYMFRNQETGEINVIYERNHGGYGILQPR